MFQRILLTLIIFSSIQIQSQNPDNFSILSLSPELTESANAVIRYEKITVEVKSIDKIVSRTHRIVTVLNKKGNRLVNAFEHYDDNSEINSIEARVYDAMGDEIKKFKERDFNDESQVSDFSIYQDDRVKYLRYVPVNYPYTIEFISEVETTNTAFFPGWYPLDDFYLAAEHSEYEIINTSGTEIKIKKENLEDYGIQALSEFHYVAEDLEAIEYEAYAPALSNTVPKVKAALKTFSMIGVEGQNNNWQDFGKWMYEKLLVGTDNIPESTKEEIRRLTDGVDSELERAKIVYQYMQERTRYISIQIGIGGWKPMLADDVDELGYGDCKGLSNYTKALLEVAGVTSYYTVIFGGSDIVNLDSEFSSLQGNHAILALPNDEDYVFLECTSQSNPFGFIAGGTDDRTALIIKPEGGEIVHTTVYDKSESFTKNTSEITLDNTGAIAGTIELKSGGILYNIRSVVDPMNERDRIMEYKEEWGYLNDLSIEKIEVINDKDSIQFTEEVDVKVKNYASKSGNRLLFQPNVFNRRSYIPPRYSERKMSFEIPRSYLERDEYVISYPVDLTVEAVSDDVNIDTKFGSYSYSIELLDNNKIKYTRTLVSNKGEYSKDEYNDYRNFRKKIVKNDKSKIVFVTK